MKKFNFVRITMLFLLVLFTITILIIIFKNLHLKTKQREIIENIKYIIEHANKDYEDEKEKICFNDEQIGIISIPSIDLEAPICEGTGQEVLKYAVRTF